MTDPTDHKESSPHVTWSMRKVGTTIGAAATVASKQYPRLIVDLLSPNEICEYSDECMPVPSSGLRCSPLVTRSEKTGEYCCRVVYLDNDGEFASSWTPRSWAEAGITSATIPGENAPRRMSALRTLVLDLTSFSYGHSIKAARQLDCQAISTHDLSMSDKHLIVQLLSSRKASELSKPERDRTDWDGLYKALRSDGTASDLPTGAG